MEATRRQFLLEAGRLVVILPASWTLAHAGCSSEEDECASAGEVAATSTEITVTSSCGDGHTHEFTITTADLTAPPAAGVSGDTTAYDDDGHVHTVALTMAELAQIEAGESVGKTTGVSNGHTHTFAFRKAGPPPGDSDPDDDPYDYALPDGRR